MSCISSVDGIRLRSLTWFLPVHWLCLTVFKAPIYFWLVTLDLTFSWLLIFFFSLGNYLITKINKSVQLLILFSLSPTINWSVPTTLILIHLPKLVIENWKKKIQKQCCQKSHINNVKRKNTGAWRINILWLRRMCIFSFINIRHYWLSNLPDKLFLDMLILDVTSIFNWERNSNKKNYESPLFSNELPRTRIVLLNFTHHHTQAIIIIIA